MNAQSKRAEARWTALIAILVLLALFLVLPSPFVPPWVPIAVTVAMLIPLIAFNPRRFEREDKWSRWLGISLALFLALVAQVNAIAAAIRLLTGNQDGAGVLLMALQAWLSLIICFGLIYWELDRGGPVRRALDSRDAMPDADFFFPQDSSDDATPEVARTSAKLGDWRASFVDYLYVSVTNMVAYSPTDTMPLSARAKILMTLQGLTGFLLFALVIARAVNIIGA